MKEELTGQKKEEQSRQPEKKTAEQKAAASFENEQRAVTFEAILSGNASVFDMPKEMLKKSASELGNSFLEEAFSGGSGDSPFTEPPEVSEQKEETDFTNHITTEKPFMLKKSPSGLSGEMTEEVADMLCDYYIRGREEFY